MLERMSLMSSRAQASGSEVFWTSLQSSRQS